MMTPKQAIEKLHSRLLSYANKHSANYDYIKDTTDIVNALIDLYNENKQCRNELKALERKVQKIADFIGYDSRLFSVDERLIDFYNENVPVPNIFIMVSGDESSAVESAIHYRAHLLMSDHILIQGMVEQELQIRSLIHIPGMDQFLIAPMSISEQCLYDYIMKNHYGKNPSSK